MALTAEATYTIRIRRAKARAEAFVVHLQAKLRLAIFVDLTVLAIGHDDLVFFIGYTFLVGAAFVGATL